MEVPQQENRSAVFSGLVDTLDAVITRELAKLAIPFPAKDLDWRVGRDGKKSNGEVWSKVLAYVDARAVMDRLDAVVGAGNWKDRYWKEGGGTMCALSIRINGEWVEKIDGSEDTDIEAFKGGISKALVRTAVKWGVGRYLYNLTEGFAVIVPADKARAQGARYQRSKEAGEYYWLPPALPAWALPAQSGDQAAGKPQGNGSAAAAVAAHTSAKTEALKGRLGSEQKGLSSPSAQGTGKAPQGAGIRSEPGCHGGPSNAGNSANSRSAGKAENPQPEPHNQAAIDSFFDAAGIPDSEPQGRTGSGNETKVLPAAEKLAVQGIPGLRGTQPDSAIQSGSDPGAESSAGPRNMVHTPGTRGGAQQGSTGGGQGPGTVVRGTPANEPPQGGRSETQDARTSAQSAVPPGAASPSSHGRGNTDEANAAGSGVEKAGTDLGSSKEVRQGGSARVLPGAGEAGKGKNAGLTPDQQFELFTALGNKLKATKTTAELRKEWISAQASLYKLSELQRTALDILKEGQKAAVK